MEPAKNNLEREYSFQELFYLIGLINQHLEDNKHTLTQAEFEFRFNLKIKLKKEIK